MKVFLLGLLLSSQAFATTCILEINGMQTSTGFTATGSSYTCNGNPSSIILSRRGNNMTEVMSGQIERVSKDENVSLISCRRSQFGNKVTETCFFQ